MRITASTGYSHPNKTIAVTLKYATEEYCASFRFFNKKPQLAIYVTGPGGYLLSNLSKVYEHEKFKKYFRFPIDMTQQEASYLMRNPEQIKLLNIKLIRR